MTIRTLPILLLMAMAPVADGISAACPLIDWERIPAADLAAIPFKPIDRRILEHRHEKRGLVTVPLDYDDPEGLQIEIFYRLMPAADSPAGAPAKPVLVVMNGGPGVPASIYRALDHDYGGDNPGDAFGELSKHFRILAIDQRGTGHSAPLDLDDPRLSPAVIARYFDSDEHARDHARVIDAVIPAGEPFFVLARSYGGHIGFQYLLLKDRERAPAGLVFSSPLLPDSQALPTFLARRQKQKELNLALRRSHPEVVTGLQRLRRHLRELGADPGAVNFLWDFLGRGTGWEEALGRQIEWFLGRRDRAGIEEELGREARETVNLLNYVLSSAALTPGFTDRSITAETGRRIPLEDWMIDENWALAQIGNDGTWRQQFICSIDRNPPPPSRFPPLREIRRALGQTRTLFTLGRTDALLPLEMQLQSLERYSVTGRTSIRVFEGGHGAAFSPEGAEMVWRWASGILGERTMGLDFSQLMNRVATGWSTNDTDLALSAFAEGAVYIEPPDLQYYEGLAELRAFFDAVRPGSSMIWHRLW